MTVTPGEIFAALEPLYGRPVNVPSGDPLAELVLTVLSQNTADANSGRAFVRLVTTYPSWQAARDAPTAELEACIAIGGLARQKAPRIQSILRAVTERSPALDLSFLASMPAAEANAWLRGLPGVGPKTAACVLLFALGRPALPVDTHVARVATRLGLLAPGTPDAKAHEELALAVQPDDYYRFHMLLIKHGRRCCSARRPGCGRCPLAAACPAAEPA